jgi:antitoxin component HigA of HigAB toxin-antitoxin module
MEIRLIHTRADYRAALVEVSALMERDPALGAPDGDRLYVRITLVQSNEARRHPIDKLMS